MDEQKGPLIKDFDEYIERLGHPSEWSVWSRLSTRDVTALVEETKLSRRTVARAYMREAGWKSAARVAFAARRLGITEPVVCFWCGRHGAGDRYNEQQ